MIEEEFGIRDNETEEEYIMRACELGLNQGMTWWEITDIINRETERNSDESTYRRRYKAYTMGLKDAGKKLKYSGPGQLRIPVEDAVVEEPKEDTKESDEECDYLSKLFEARLSAQKEKVKLSDERVQINAYIRRLAREETLKEIGLQAAQMMNDKKLLSPVRILKNNGVNSAELLISDWHLGIEFDNYINSYNLDIAQKRLSDLRDKVTQICLANNVKRLNVVNLSDLIAGRIHLQIRLSSRIDVIQQTQLAAELLAEMLSEFADEFEVHYYDCLDNHSRVEPNKKESMNLESFALFIPWYLKGRKGVCDKGVVIHDNKLGPDIITFTEKGHKILGVHGDKDALNDIVRKMSTMTHEYYDMIVTAHLHHFNADEQNETLIVSNGSLMGTDDYAYDKRLSSKPSQTLIITTDDCVAHAIYRIVV